MFEQLYPNLHSLIEHINAIRSALKEPVIDLTVPLDKTATDAIYGHLECKMSPENLHCDGEISRADAMQKRDYFLACAEELGTLTGDKREIE